MKSLFQRQASWRSPSHDHQSGTRKTKSVQEDRWGTTVSSKPTKQDRPLSVPRSSSMQHLQHPPNHNHHTASTQLPMVAPPRRPRRASIADFAPPPMLPNHEDDTAADHKMSDCTTSSTSTKPKKTKKKDLQSESNNNNNIPKKDPKAKKSSKVPTNNSVEKKQEKKKKKKKKSEKSTLESGSMKKTTTKPKSLKTKTKKKKKSKSVPSTQDEGQHYQSWTAADGHTASMSLLLASPCPSYSSLPPLSPSASFTSLQSSSVVSVASHTTSTTWSTTSSATGTSLAGSTASSSSSSGRFHLPGGGMDHLHNHNNETSSRKRVRTIRLDLLPPPKSILVHPDQHATTRNKNRGPKSILKKAPKHVHFSSKDGSTTTTTLLSRPRAGLLVPPSSPLEELTPAEQDQYMFWTTAELAAIQQRTNRLVQSVLQESPPQESSASASGRSRSRSSNPSVPQVVACLQQCYEEPSSSSGTHHHSHMSPEKAMQTFFFCQVPEPTTTVVREPFETHDNNDKEKDPHRDTAKDQHPKQDDRTDTQEDWEWTTLRGLERYLLPTALREGRRYQTIQSVLELQRVISNEMRHQQQEQEREERPEQQSRPSTRARPTNRDSLYQDDDEDDDRKEHSQDKRHQTASESKMAAGDNEVWTLSRLEQALRNQSCRTSRAAQRVARLLAKGDAAIVGARRNRPTTTGSSSSSSQPVSSSSSTASSSRPGS